MREEQGGQSVFKGVITILNKELMPVKTERKDIRIRDRVLLPTTTEQQ